MTTQAEKNAEAATSIVRLGILVVGCAIEAFTISRLWNWYVAIPWHLPKMTMFQGYGIGLMLGLATYQFIPRSDDEKTKNTRTGLAVAIPLICLTLGFLVHKLWGPS